MQNFRKMDFSEIVDFLEIMDFSEITDFVLRTDMGQEGMVYLTMV